MAKQKEIKTNAMRMLDRMKIPYEAMTYECGEFIDGIQIADKLGLPHEKVYKTLVTVGNSKNYFVFVLPIEGELDLKKAAREVGEKSLAMLHVKDINTVTGYVRGGCTAVGMKKQYVTRIDASAQNLPTMVVSGGHLGTQLELKPGGSSKSGKCRICRYCSGIKWVGTRDAACAAAPCFTYIEITQTDLLPAHQMLLVLRHHLHPQHLSREYASMPLFSLRYLPYGQRWRYTIR